MLVTRRQFAEVVRRFEAVGDYGLDTETTGLRESDRLFSLILSAPEETYYINLNPISYPSGVPLNPEFVIPREWLGRLSKAFGNPGSTWFIQNAKFDMRMLWQEGLELRGVIWDTEAMARVIQNNRLQYNLATLAKDIGQEKDDRVTDYVTKNKLWTESEVPGVKRKEKRLHYDRVPFDLMSEYAIQDAKVVRELGLYQREILARMDSDEGGAPPITPLARNEQRLTKTCFRMERRGVLINRDYVTKALAHELRLVEEAVENFELATGVTFNDGPKCLTMAFDKLGEPYPLTEKGNPSFSAEVLEQMTTPVAAMVNTIRKHSKIAGTYYSAFLYRADENDILRADIRQAGTETGRFSYREPNLQNVPKEEEIDGRPFYVRSSFIPRPDHCLVMIDYQQQEFRMILDYAGEKKLIADVMAGADVHQATADQTGLSRKNAKTINFGLAYGMGVVLLATKICNPSLPLPALNVVWKKHNGRERLTQEEKELYAKLDPTIVKADLQEILKAQGMKETYFAKLPKVKRFFKEVINKAAKRSYVWNWAGRRCHIADPEFAFIAPNHIIQGGGADVIKHAMNDIDDMLIREKCRSGMIVQVHDEILFEIHRQEVGLVPKIKSTMETIYKPKNGMYLTCSVEHSWKSWGTPDRVAGEP